MSTDEQDLIVRARNRDHVAFMQLLQMHDERIRALVFRLTGSRSAMEDALQEAYLKAYKNIHQLKDDANVAGWLYRIAYNAAVDSYRRVRNTNATYDDTIGHVSDGSDQQAMRTDIHNALMTLPVEQRAVVLLVDVEGFDYAASAAILDTKPGTVASRLSTARAALRTTLQMYKKDAEQ